MLAIILVRMSLVAPVFRYLGDFLQINVVFLVLVIASLVRSQRRKMEMQDGKRVDLVK